MTDMLGNPLAPGDIVMSPGGNPRYGGLHLEVGIVVRLTDKRVRVISTKLVADRPHKFKASNRTGSKLLIMNDPEVINQTVIDLLAIERDKELNAN